MKIFFISLLAAYSLGSLSTFGAFSTQPVWSDEFNGTSIDRTKWTYDTGGGGWGNNELEFYTDRALNSYIGIAPTDQKESCLVIEARKETYRNRSYTSARLKTQGLANWKYGRIEARMIVPNGQGVWPAFWMLGSNFTDVGWPACGELDIMEHVIPQLGPTGVRASAHAPGYFGAQSVHCDTQVANLSSVFHLFALEWSPGKLQYFVDTQLYLTVDTDKYTCGTNASGLPGAWIFDHPFFIILNLAIGGDWPGAPDGTTQFPVKMWVDYVKVYANLDQQPPTGPYLKVASIDMTTGLNGPNWQAIAKVKVVDDQGAAASGVTVTGVWSGLINVGVNQATTDSAGMATLSSGRVKEKGTINFCVTNLAKTGYSSAADPTQDCKSVTQ